MKKLLIALAITILPGLALAGTLDCSKETNLYNLMQCVARHMPNYSGYFTAAPGARPYLSPSDGVDSHQWKHAVNRMLMGQCNFKLGSNLGKYYTDYTYQEKGRSPKYCVLVEKDEGLNGKVRLGWGTFIVNEHPLREVNFFDPHPLFDENTWKQSINVFEETQGRSVMISGAYRYSSDDFSTCQPTSYYGGESGQGNAADPAHNNDLAFQATAASVMQFYTTAINNYDKVIKKYPDLPPLNHLKQWAIIELHAMASSTCGHNSIELTYGANSHFVSDEPNGHAFVLAQDFQKYNPKLDVNFMVWGQQTSACKSAGVNCTEQCAETGGSDVTGRLINNVAPQLVCGHGATFDQVKGHFIHIEQAPPLNFDPTGDYYGKQWVKPIDEDWQPLQSNK